jgi:hypothetical protein
MTSIPQSNNQGAVFELIARGQKDKFFFSEDGSSKWAFDNAYKSSVPFVSERRTIVPLNAPHFGNTFEIEIDKYGDILTECTLLIDLPTWFPPLALVPGGPTVDPKIVNDRYDIYSSNERIFARYGYTNFIGYYLFDSIQFYQDQNLIQEWSGESLFATQITEGSWNSSFLDQKNAGAFQTDSTNTPYTAIRRNATPGQLRIKLPLPGIQAPNDGGFPLCCAPSQVYRLRIRLRQLEHLVVSSNTDTIKPAPWNNLTFSYDTPLGQITFNPLTRDQIGQPTIVLETVQVYVKDDIQSALQTRLVTIPFRKVYQNIFTIGELDYKPLDLMGGGVATITRQLDARHIGERLIYMFRTGENLDKNRLDDLYNRLDIPDGSFYSGMKLVIAGQDREFYFEDFLWKDIQALVKDERDNNWGIGEMRWSLGDLYDRERPAPRQPEGGVNFSTADRPTLYIQLKNVPIQPTLEQRRTELRVFIESWAVYEFQEGRGRLVFGA